MGSLKEVFVSYKVDSAKAVQQIKLVDKEIDKTIDSFGEVEDAADNAGQAVVDSAKKGESAWKKFGDAHEKVVKKLGNAKPYLDFGKSIATGIAVGTAALVGIGGVAGKFVADWAHGAQVIERTSKQYGVSTDALQEWQYAVKSVGGDSESVGELFKELGLRLAEVGETGTGSALDALTLLKIRIEDIRKLKPEDQMDLIADRLSQVVDVGARTFIKDSLFGGEFEKVGEVLELGSEGIAALRKEARDLGGVLSGEALRDAAQFNKEMVKTKTIVGGVGSEIAITLLPKVQEIVKAIGDWVRENRGLITSRVDDFIRGVSDAARKLGPLLSDGLDLVVDISNAVGGIENAIMLSAGAWAAWQTAALAAIGPVGVALAGVAASAALAGLITTKANEDRIESTKALNRKAAITDKAIELVEAGDPRAQEIVALLNSIPDLLQNDSAVNESANALLTVAEGIYADFKTRQSQVPAADGEEKPKPKRTLGRIAKPGEETPITAESEIKAALKRAAELDRDRAIRADLEARLFNAEGPERMAIESALRGVEKRITGQDIKGIHELMAEAVGQGTGLGAGALKPAGLGTTINHIDASITINVGGVKAEVPASAVAPGRSIMDYGQAVAEQLTSIFTQASRLQIAQING